MDLQVLADSQHSVPTSVTVSTENGSRHLDLPPIANGRTEGSVVNIPLSFPDLTGQHITVTFDTVRLVDTVNYSTQSKQALPLGIAEVASRPPRRTVAGGHPHHLSQHLLSIDGTPVWIAVSGTTPAALARTNPLNVSLCGPDSGGIPLGAGAHTLHPRTGRHGEQPVGRRVRLDRLALDSAPGGAPAPPASTSAIAAPPAMPATAVAVTSQTATSMHLRVSGARPRSIWSWARASTGAGRPRSGVQGRSGNPCSSTVRQRLDGVRYRPGQGRSSGSFDVTLTWTPQTRVDVALIVSALTILLCLLLAYLPAKVRRRIPASRPHGSSAPAQSDGAGAGRGRPAGTTTSGRTSPPMRRDCGDVDRARAPAVGAVSESDGAGRPGWPPSSWPWPPVWSPHSSPDRSPGCWWAWPPGSPVAAPVACSARRSGDRTDGCRRDLHGRRAGPPARLDQRHWAGHFRVASNLAWAAVVFWAPVR